MLACVENKVAQPSSSWLSGALSFGARSCSRLPQASASLSYEPLALAGRTTLAGHISIAPALVGHMALACCMGLSGLFST